MGRKTEKREERLQFYDIGNQVLNPNKLLLGKNCWIDPDEHNKSVIKRHYDFDYYYHYEWMKQHDSTITKQ